MPPSRRVSAREVGLRQLGRQLLPFFGWQLRGCRPPHSGALTSASLRARWTVPFCGSFPLDCRISALMRARW
eukprot:14886896-Alexandrium_andersonii.AAC.1